MSETTLGHAIAKAIEHGWRPTWGDGAPPITDMSGMAVYHTNSAHGWVALEFPTMTLGLLLTTERCYTEADVAEDRDFAEDDPRINNYDVGQYVTEAIVVDDRGQVIECHRSSAIMAIIDSGIVDYLQP